MTKSAANVTSRFGCEYSPKSRISLYGFSCMAWTDLVLSPLSVCKWPPVSHIKASPLLFVLVFGRRFRSWFYCR